MSSDFVTPIVQVHQPGGLVLQKWLDISSFSCLVASSVRFDIYNSLFYFISLFLLLVLFFSLFLIFYADFLFLFIH